jgi:hypothetical protein
MMHAPGDGGMVPNASPRPRKERPLTGKSATHRPSGPTSGAARCRSKATGAVLSPLPPKRSHSVALADTPGRRAVSLVWPMYGARPERYGGLALGGFVAVDFMYGPSHSRSRRRSALMQVRGAFPFVRGSVDSGSTAVYTHLCVRWGRAAVVMGAKLAYELPSVPQPPPTAARPAPPNRLPEA